MVIRVIKTFFVQFFVFWPPLLSHGWMQVPFVCCRPWSSACVSLPLKTDDISLCHHKIIFLARPSRPWMSSPRVIFQPRLPFLCASCTYTKQSPWHFPRGSCTHSRPFLSRCQRLLCVPFTVGLTPPSSDEVLSPFPSPTSALFPCLLSQFPHSAFSAVESLPLFFFFLIKYSWVIILC